MHTVPRRLRALCLLSLVASSAFVATAPVATVSAADAPWTLPTVPPQCSTTAMNSGNVAGCVITLGSGLPETRGWPAAPFPRPTNPTVLAWVNLTSGSTGNAVADVQQALDDQGASLSVDGQFGLLTLWAVKAYQQDNSLPVTGIVDATMAEMLKVQNTTGGTFPPVGWKWLGWGYNGSPALAAFEKLFVSNTQQIGSLKPGQLKSFPDALPLFEGFLAEIQAKGYTITDGGTYVFRCTASTRKDCAGLQRGSLSNHAYGLASDINTGKNPMQTDVGINGASACKTPVITNLPQWVVQTAEKWGLYWGGYGWSSGCSSPSQSRTSVTRDPMHFEFNGTVDQAKAILRANVGSGACFPVVDDLGVQSDRCLLRGEVPDGGTRIVIDTNAPAGATAVMVNITLTGAQTTGYAAAEDCGAVPAGDRAWSNANARLGRAVAAAAVVPIDAQGHFCLYQSGTFHSIVDVEGFFSPAAAAPSGNLYTPIAPVRVVDTRTSPWCSPDGSCNDPSPVPANTPVVAAASVPVDAVAAMANLTVVGAGSTGFLTADTCPVLAVAGTTHSNVNFVAGDRAITNLAVVPTLSTDMGAQFCTVSPTSQGVVVDVLGVFAPAAQGGLGYTTLAPSRLVDTRKCWTDPITTVQRCAMVNTAGSVVRMRAPAGANVVLLNLTTTLGAAFGFVAADRCSVINGGVHDKGSVQIVPGSAVANLTVVPVDSDGTFCAWVSSTTHLVVDLFGTFSPTGGLRFVPITPERVLDSRQPA